MWNIDGGRDFDLDDGGAFISWEFVPPIKPTTVRFRLHVDDVPTVEKPHAPPARGELNSLSNKNSSVWGSLNWGDFVKSARSGSPTIVRVDVLSAPKTWKRQLLPGELDGMTAVGDFGMQRTINPAALRNVEAELRKLAQETALRPADVPHRCARQEPFDENREPGD